MNEKSIRRTLFNYLCITLLAGSIASMIVLMLEYRPFDAKTADKLGWGVIVSNSVLWNLFLTVTGSLYLLNVNRFVRDHNALSFLAFILAPLLMIAIIIITVAKVEDLFAFAESAVCFVAIQIFFFFRFRRCIKTGHHYNEV